MQILLSAAAVGVAASDLRRNVVTSGIRLHDLIGVDFGIGGALLRGVRPCEPCQLLDRRTGAGLRSAVAAVTGDSTGADRMLTE